MAADLAACPGAVPLTGVRSVDFTVVIPFEPNRDPARLAGLGCVERWYAGQGFPLVIGSGGQPWSKGVAVDDGFARVETEGVIVADADCLVSCFDLGRATLVVAAGAPWAQPHSMVYRLHRKATGRVLAGHVVPDGMAPARVLCERPPHPAPAGGGIVVLSRDAYRTVGGIDDRFVGWGGEDISFARALDTLVGPGVRFDGALWHLWHRPQVRLRGNRACPANEELAGRYLAAVGDPVAMREVIDS